MVQTDERDRCWLCKQGHIVETIEENYKVERVPGAGTVTIPKVRVGRCDHCHQVVYAVPSE